MNTPKPRVFRLCQRPDWRGCGARVHGALYLGGRPRGGHRRSSLSHRQQIPAPDGDPRHCARVQAVILPFIVLNLHLVVHWKEIIDKIRCPNCILLAAFFTAEFLYRPLGLLTTAGTIPAQNVRSRL